MLNEQPAASLGRERQLGAAAAEDQPRGRATVGSLTEKLTCCWQNSRATDCAACISAASISKGEGLLFYWFEAGVFRSTPPNGTG